MIICGYAGIGKSWIAHSIAGVIDLESTPFEKDWDRYAKCAIHYHNQGYLVLLSCHKEIRERICDNVPYDFRLTIVPNIKDKGIYAKRYVERGNTTEFIRIQMENWEKWLDEQSNRLITEHWEVMLPEETLSDCITRLSKEPPYRFCNYDQCPVSACEEMEGRCVNPLNRYNTNIK